MPAILRSLYISPLLRQSRRIVTLDLLANQSDIDFGAIKLFKFNRLWA
jgi:hypothetical protein